MVNRILGLLVVLAVGVLAYPYIFNPHGSFSGHGEAMIPAPVFPSAHTQNDTIAALSKQEDLKPLTHKKTKHAHVAIKNVAWVIQVGSYNDKTRALSLVNELRSKGYNAFIQQRSAALGEDIQVLIGPELKRDSAVLTASKLSKETQLSGVVKTYKLLAA